MFVVLEGEITVVLHTTQFVAKKGDSFYIPPKNYYNLINQKVREAELSLIQFQYDGPLPTVSAGSQSGKANVWMECKETPNWSILKTRNRVYYVKNSANVRRAKSFLFSFVLLIIIYICCTQDVFDKIAS